MSKLHWCKLYLISWYGIEYIEVEFNTFKGAEMTGIEDEPTSTLENRKWQKRGLQPHSCYAYGSDIIVSVVAPKKIGNIGIRRLCN